MRKESFLYVFTISAIVLMGSAFIFAQDERIVSAAGNRYVISAEAGGVNYTEGKVYVRRKNGKSGLLLKGDTLKVGDEITTGADGRAEILLNPGSYLRLSSNSSFEFKTTSLENLQLKLNSGSAMLEVITDSDFTFAVNTPKSNFYVLKSGVYRVDVLADGSGKMAVWKGLAQVGEDEGNKIKKGREAVDDGDLSVAKFDRDEKDALEEWSKARAKELAKNNAKFERKNLRNSLINSFNNNRWNLFESFGLWVFNPYSGSYCFLPFGYGWSSPYGYGLGYDMWNLRMPRYIFFQPPPNNNNNNQNPPNVTLGNGNITGTGGRNTRGAVRGIDPPFSKIQRDIDRTPIQTDSGGSGLLSPGFPSGARRGNPSSVPPTSMPPSPADSDLPGDVPIRKGKN